jgi:hypothetical protein
MLSIAPLLLAAVFFATPAPLEPLTESAVLEAPTRHIRTTDRSVRQLLRRGYRESRTFADLVARLQRSNLIVYIESVPRLPGALEGRLMILPTAHGQRYVRIQIAPRGSPEDSIALLGHELRHAVEVADATDVSDSAGLARLYQRIGVPSGPFIYDTLEAQETGRMVRKELAA